MTGRDASPSYIARACEASLRRLNTDCIDLYQFHLSEYDPASIAPVCEALDRLVTDGKIRYYAWASETIDGCRIFAEREHCPAVQFGMNMFKDDPDMVALCDEYNLAGIVNGPLGKGILTGKFDAATRFSGTDLRHQRGWDLQNGPLAQQRGALEQLCEILTSDGRTLGAGGARCTVGAQRPHHSDTWLQDRGTGAGERGCPAVWTARSGADAGDRRTGRVRTIRRANRNRLSRHSARRDLIRWFAAFALRGHARGTDAMAQVRCLTGQRADAVPNLVSHRYRFLDAPAADAAAA